MQPGGDPQRPPQGSPPFYNPQGPQTPPPHHQPPHGSPVNPQFKPAPGPFPPHQGPPPGGPFPPQGFPGGPQGPPPFGRPPGPPGPPGPHQGPPPPGHQGPPPGQRPPGPPGPFPPPHQQGPPPPGGQFPPPHQQGPPPPGGQFPPVGSPQGPPRGPPPQGPGPIHGPPGQFPLPSQGPSQPPYQGTPQGPPQGPSQGFPPQGLPQGGPPPSFNPSTPPPPNRASGQFPPSATSPPPPQFQNPNLSSPGFLNPNSNAPPQFHNPNTIPQPQFHNPNSFPQRQPSTTQLPPTRTPPPPGPQPPISGAPQGYPPSGAPQGYPPSGAPQGYPPTGYPPTNAPHAPAPAPTPAPPAAPASRIDPAQIPSPTTVADGKTVKYLTSQLSCPPPPPASVQYVSIDEGNATPRFVRMSQYSLPCTDELQHTSHIPFSMLVQPLAETLPGEEPVPLVDLSAAGGPVRCRRCHAYMNPFNIFVDGGRKYICKLCSCENDVPEAYFSPVEPSGKRHDYASRPELSRGSVDIIASNPEYNTRTPARPSFVFALDVSETAVTSGLLQTCINALRSLLVELAEQPQDSDGPVDPNIGIITYDATIHFWNIRPTLAQPQMLVVSDLTNVFVPLSANSLLVPYSQSRAVVDTLLDKLPELFRTGRPNHSAMPSVVHASSLALEQAGGGRAIVFWSGVEPGNAATKRREELKAVGTDKEKTLLTPRNPALKTLATECIARAASVDLFLCTSGMAQPIDVASLAVLPSLTGAGLFYYPGFEAERDSDRLAGEVRRVISRPAGYDAVAKVRTSAGITVVDYLGNFKLSSANDLEFATIDCDKTILVNLKHDDKLDEKTDSIIQFAMLYTSSKGDRRIRVHTIALSNTNTIGNLYKNADLDTILNVYARQVVRDMQSNTLSAVRTSLVDKCVDVLAAYRKHCASTTSPGQLILPESLKLLPIYVLALTKHALFRSTVDVQAFSMHQFNDMSAALSTPTVYPRLYPLHKLATDSQGVDDTGRTVLPTPQRLISDYLEADGVYLLENGHDMYLWLGRNAQPSATELVQEVSAVCATTKNAAQMPRTHAHTDRALRFVRAVRAQRCKGASVRVVRARDTLEPKLMSLLVEDRVGETLSYVDFLVQVHKMIQGRLA